MTAAATTTTAGGDPAVARYEELRHGVITRAPGHQHYGVIVLLREGLAAWLAHEPARLSAVHAAAAPPGRPAAPPVRGELHQSLVRVLATMALAGRREVHP